VNINLLEFLAIMGRINPAIWDAIHPMGPERAVSFLSPGEAVELNPQPLPPRVAFQLAAARVANEIALAAVAAEAAGNDEAAEQIITTAADDWCGTPSGHRPIPWPGPWPFPSYLQDPDPHPWLVDTVRLVAGLTFASVGSRLTEGAAREALEHGAERLTEAAIAGGRAEHMHAPLAN
jgi:hypothetical protein